jgi:hypothetical protein
MVIAGMQKHGLTEEQAKQNLWVLDKDGLVTLKREVSRKVKH